MKAAFIFNFAKLTRWPHDAWPAKGTALRLCTAGSDPVVNALKALEGMPVQGHPVAVHPIGERWVARTCHVLYIAHSDKAGLSDLAASVGARPVLTISERHSPGQPAAMIQLYTEDGRIRFLINLGAARASGLDFSSRLLSLGTVVDEGAAR